MDLGTVSIKGDGTYSQGSFVSRDSWLLIAVFAYGVAAFYGPADAPGLHPAMVAALVGFVAATFSLVAKPRPTAAVWTPAMLVVGCFLLMRIAEPFVTAELPPTRRLLMLFWFPLVLTVGCASAMVLIHRGQRGLSVAVLTVSLAVSGTLVLTAFGTQFIDVLLVHDAAFEAVAQGESPYGGSVSVPDTSPYAPAGRMIVGYPYPPVTAFVYVLGVWALGDPRWISLVMLIGAAGCLTLGFANEREFQLPAALLLASLPGMPIIILQGFTEPLTLFLCVLTFLFWDRRPLAAAILGGLTLASKQYMLVLAPLLLIAAFRRSPKQAGVMAIAGAATVVPFLVFGWNDLLRSTVINLAELTPRPDGSSIQSLLLNLGSGLRIPLVVSLAVPAILGVLLATRAHTRRDVATSACLVLTIFFLLARQAFLNYWFLVAGLAILALTLPSTEPLNQHPDRDDQRPLPVRNTT